MLDWVNSPRSGVAFLDLRYEPVEVKDSTRLLEVLPSYYARGQVSRVIVALPGDPPPPVQSLAHAVKLQAVGAGVGFEEQRT
jgi:hypothetical protein